MSTKDVLIILKQVPPSEGAVRMLQQYHDNLLLGTTTNSILTTTIAKHSAPLTDAVINKQFLTQVNMYVDIKKVSY